MFNIPKIFYLNFSKYVNDTSLKFDIKFKKKN